MFARGPSHLYADDRVIVTEHLEEWQGTLEDGEELFKKRGLKMHLDKTEVMWLGKYIWLQWKVYNVNNDEMNQSIHCCRSLIMNNCCTS